MDPRKSDSSAPILVVAFGGSLLGVNAQTGERIWQRKVGDFKTDVVRLAFANDCVFALTASLACLEYATGQLRWITKERDGYSGGTLLVQEERVFVGSAGGVSCYSAADGTALWADDYKGLGTARVALGSPGNLAQADSSR